MIFSDHGMANVTKTVDITNAFDTEDIKVLLPEVPYVSIWPMEGKLEKVCIFVPQIYRSIRLSIKLKVFYWIFEWNLRKNIEIWWFIDYYM